MSDKPGGYVGQALLTVAGSIAWSRGKIFALSKVGQQAAPGNVSTRELAERRSFGSLAPPKDLGNSVTSIARRPRKRGGLPWLAPLAGSFDRRPSENAGRLSINPGASTVLLA
jgi:hypothetical protein